MVAYNLENDKTITVQVKSGVGRWGIGSALLDEGVWKLVGFSGKADFHVFVNTSSGKVSDFEYYVVPTENLVKIVGGHIQDKMSRRRTERNSLTGLIVRLGVIDLSGLK